MTVVIGTAGHIDHGKTTLLRALTGIDADRLPEEQRRGMTIDVGYAHSVLPDGPRSTSWTCPATTGSIGNMLVGAGEIDAAMLVVAADDGPRAQTLEHLALLDALGIGDGLAVVTKADRRRPEARAARVAQDVEALLAGSSLAGVPVIVGFGRHRGRAGLRQVGPGRARDLCLARADGAPRGPRRLAIDRAFAVKGRGAVVTGTLRGGELRTGDALRVEPGGTDIRVRGLQVHHAAVEVATGGRTAVNIAGAQLAQLSRGAVLTGGPAAASGTEVVVTDRLLVALARPMDAGAAWRRGSGPAWPPADGARLRLHIGTAAVDAIVGRRGREAVVLPDDRATVLLRLSKPIATLRGERAVLRRPSPGEVVAGVRVLDGNPAHGIARRRATPNGSWRSRSPWTREMSTRPRMRSWHSTGSWPPPGGSPRAHPRARSSRRPGARSRRARHGPRPGPADRDRIACRHRPPGAPGCPSTAGNRPPGRHTRRGCGDRRGDRRPRRAAPARPGWRPSPDPRALPDRPRSWRRRWTGSRPSWPCPRRRLWPRRRAPPVARPTGIARLEAAGRIVRVEANLAWSTREFQRLAGVALAMARRAPPAPAAFRDATATNRRVVMPFLEDLGRRGILSRTPAGHVPGPRAPREAAG